MYGLFAPSSLHTLLQVKTSLPCISHGHEAPQVLPNSPSGFSSSPLFGRRVLPLLSLSLPISLSRPLRKPGVAFAAAVTEKSIHDFTVKDIDGKDVSLNKFKGKVLLIVNVASKCGLTKSNYTELTHIYEKYKPQGFDILGFPCNQFGGQEPGTNSEIKEFACTRFKAEFPIFDKVDVNGPNTAPIYQFLKSSTGGFLGDVIKWNFEKFLVNRDGKVAERYSPTTSPFQIEKDIQKLLIPWIMKWDYTISVNNTADYTYIPRLGKTISVKWWDIFKMDLTTTTPKRMPQQTPKYQPSPTTANTSFDFPTYLRNMLQTNLNASKEELEKQMKEIFAEAGRKPVSSEETVQSSPLHTNRYLQLSEADPEEETDPKEDDPDEFSQRP
ncbi:phospholipid hydroperoxide glutathione peroxidase 1, chloroplastic [Amborella trichopoda]|uniref:phospholipid hydroperoxide glutathione peroxidase 1, chloroplastic n=1 Tax=Amborella trichopoda TaxID=13333 RepID=UPI0009BED62A|nr:phospholipid hydroperoxide glutathione peroxidase 1, chloroplastic [Amborella trichopoda]|eukprot:XP_020530839.1 phospholipid hydroperoxide glutathione peroxidase 1, chloroplastic [Amborella trichopoda]